MELDPDKNPDPKRTHGTCPTCGAGEGERCDLATKDTVPADHVIGAHRARVDRAIEAGLPPWDQVK